MQTAIRLALFIALTVSGACGSLTPKTYQLEQIHATYTAEWAASEFPGASAQPGVAKNYDRFKGTLAAIHNYKTTYGAKSKVGAHLTVLEGMIYLQSGKPGMARLVATDISNLATTLKTPTGVATRDFILASCFTHLVDGWEAIQKLSSDSTKYSDAADGIVAILGDLGPEERAAAEVDSGGIYVATSAAIFYVWSHAADLENVELKDMAKKGANAIDPWLTDHERTAAGAAEPGEVRNDRQRFVDWYRWLLQKSG